MTPEQANALIERKMAERAAKGLAFSVEMEDGHIFTRYCKDFHEFVQKTIMHMSKGRKLEIIRN